MSTDATDRGAKERAGEMQERYTFLASLYEVMEGNGVVIGDDTRTAANMIVKVKYQLLSEPLFYMVLQVYPESGLIHSSNRQRASNPPLSVRSLKGRHRQPNDYDHRHALNAIVARGVELTMTQYPRTQSKHSRALIALELLRFTPG